jgi:DNA-binding transcriptional MerR regulator
MSAESARAYFTIGEVLAQLRGEFADVSISKIRFLESEGLIEPARSPSGYRRFGPADVERLRYILAAQRDKYLPLRVIKDRLAAIDRGEDPGPRAPLGLVATTGRGTAAGTAAGGTGDAIGHPAGDAAAGTAARSLLTRRELASAAGINDEMLTELEDFGLVERTGRHFDPEAITVASMAAALARFGVQPRHLRAVKAAAERETALIDQVVAPILRQRSPGARDRAAEVAREIAALSLRLHAALVEAGLRAGRTQ